jgi:hypothetical protein
MIRRHSQSLDTFVLKEYEIFNRLGGRRGAVWMLTRKRCSKRFSRYFT